MLTKLQIPKTILWLFSLFLVLLLLFTGFRLITFFAFRPPDAGLWESFPAFMLGLRYDLKWIAIVLAPVVVLSIRRSFSPFYSVTNQKFWIWYMGAVFFIIFFILYFTFHDWRDAFNTLLSLPFALTGGVLMVYIWGENLSVAVAVGFIALFVIAVETGVVMMIYLEEAMQRMVKEKGDAVDVKTLRHYIMEGAVRRLRPKLMTVCVALFGLVPVLWSHGTGIELMRPIALPMIGGMVSSTLLTLIVIPVIYAVIKGWNLQSR